MRTLEEDKHVVLIVRVAVLDGGDLERSEGLTDGQRSDAGIVTANRARVRLDLVIQLLRPRQRVLVVAQEILDLSTSLASSHPHSQPLCPVH